MDDRVDRLLFIPVTPFAGEDNPFLGTNDDATAADSKMVENISELTNENRITSSGLGPHQWRVPPQPASVERGTSRCGKQHPAAEFSIPAATNAPYAEALDRVEKAAARPHRRLLFTMISRSSVEMRQICEIGRGASGRGGAGGAARRAGGRAVGNG